MGGGTVAAGTSGGAGGVPPPSHAGAGRIMAPGGGGGGCGEIFATMPTFIDHTHKFKVIDAVIVYLTRCFR